jgi:hypothetical protein
MQRIETQAREQAYVFVLHPGTGVEKRSLN